MKIHLITLAVILVCFPAETKASAKDEVENAFTRVEKLMNWDSYRSLFKKEYSSIHQELVRHKIFLSRALDVFKTSCRYMMNLSKHWTSINKYSDLTPDESRKILLGEISEADIEGYTDDEAATSRFLETIDDDELTQNNVDQVIAQERNKTIHEHSSKTRRRRSTEETNQPERILTAEDLIRLDKPEPEVENLQPIIPSNNPDYVPVNISNNTLPDQTQNLANDVPQRYIDMVIPKANSAYQTSVAYLKNSLDHFYNYASDLISFKIGENSDEATKDVIESSAESASIIKLNDWRDSNCIGPIQNQEFCNCCYAMSSTAYMEWALCMDQNKQFTPLSVQYMVSCGPRFSQATGRNLNGCGNGMSNQASYFFRDYGIELEANIPYVDMGIKCPVPINATKKQMGYIRPNLNEPVRLSPRTNRLDLALRVGPVVVSMRVPSDFLEYGGGILENCDSSTGHSMLIVGNAIEQGTEYLIMKNSFGTGWGHDGYLKFKRSAAEKCVKEYISLSVTFPSLKSRARHIKAYLANKMAIESPQEDLRETLNGEISSLYGE